MILSILIPAYNEGKTIKRLVDSVQSVNYPIPHELLIVDDASTDTDRELEKELRQSESLHTGTIRILKNRINRGKGYSIRKGIRKMRGDIVIIQDADYEYNPQDIPKLI